MYVLNTYTLGTVCVFSLLPIPLVKLIAGQTLVSCHRHVSVGNSHVSSSQIKDLYYNDLSVFQQCPCYHISSESLACEHSPMTAVSMPIVNKFLGHFNAQSAYISSHYTYCKIQ